MNNFTVYYTSPFCYPVLSICSLIHTDSHVYSIPYIRHSKDLIIKSSIEVDNCIIDNNFLHVSLIWYSIMENTYYAYQNTISLHDFRFQNVLIELIPKGYISILNYNDSVGNLKLFDSCIHLNSESGIIEQQLFSEYRDVITNRKDLILLQKRYKNILESLGYSYSNVINGIYSFHQRYQRYNYRYLPLFENWDTDLKYWTGQNLTMVDVETFAYISFDGSFCKVLTDCLELSIKGKPYVIKIEWNDIGDEYYACYWLDEEIISSVFERFYGAHPDTKTDFIIRIDAEQKKYELALFRQGLKEPQIIPEDAYQLLVFKNKFEHYRSDNYNQESGAWIW